MIAVRNKLSVLGHKIVMVFLSLPVLLFTGCNIWEDLPECPPTTGKVWIGLSFTYHNTKDDNGNYKDLFGETVRRTDLFVFNENNLLVKRIKDTTGPFKNGYRIPVELPAGTYHAVAWNNLYSNGATLISPEPVEGKTKEEDLTVQLSELEKKQITLHSLPLLYGRTGSFTISENDLTRAGDSVIPISLLQNTNEVNVTIEWLVAGTGEPCHDASHAESTHIYIKDNNGIYDFGNVPVFCAFGKKRRVYETRRDGSTVLRKYVDCNFVTDERIVDGFYFASVLRCLHNLLHDPWQLDRPPEQVVRDVD